MRIAFFGGTFDPVHRGHLAVATAAADHFALETVFFSPTGLQPLKPEGATASYEDRLQMVELGCAADPRFQASSLDSPRSDGTPNYTVHVLKELRLNFPSAIIFNLVGVDSFRGLPRWHQPERLLDLAEWIVVSRPGYTLDLVGFTQRQRTRIHILDSVHEDVSATGLRHRLQQGAPCLDLIPASVSAYIQAHHLYRVSQD